MDGAARRDAARMGEESLAALIARAHHALTERFHAEVRGHGLSDTEWRVLAALSEHDGVAMTALAEAVLFKQPTLTKAINRMERSQLVLRQTPAEDRRRTLVHLTERGRDVATPLLSRARQHDSAISRALGETQSRELAASLKALLDRLAELPRAAKPMRRRRDAAQGAGG